jgi:hypothetical protein
VLRRDCGAANGSCSTKAVVVVGITYKNLEAATYVFNPDDNNPMNCGLFAFGTVLPAIEQNHSKIASISRQSPGTRVDIPVRLAPTPRCGFGGPRTPDITSLRPIRHAVQTLILVRPH